MFIDYLSALLINLVATFVLLSLYVYLGLDDPNQRRWVPGFAVTGFISLSSGLHMLWNWPLPSSYNIAFGGPSVLLGIVLLGAALALALSWDLMTLGVYGVFIGAMAIVIGIRIIVLGMTQVPALSGVGFILSGVAGLLAVPTLFLRGSRAFRFLVALVPLAAAVIWAIIGYGAVWEHLAEFAPYTPG